MPLFPKSAESARDAVTAADATVAEWEAKANDARAAAAKLEDASGAAILDDPTQAERITVDVLSLERQARAFDGAAAEARKRAAATRRAWLEAEAAEEDRQAAAAAKTEQKHVRERDRLLAQLTAHDKADYVVASLVNSTTGLPSSSRQPTEAGRLGAITDRHQTRAAIIRHYLSHGQVAQSYFDLGMGVRAGLSLHERAGIPACVLEVAETEATQAVV